MTKPRDLKDAAANIALELNEAGFLKIDGVRISKPLRIIEKHLRLLVPEKCATEGCRNEARYTSGFCGVCDTIYNNAKGVRKCDLQDD